MTQCEEIKAFLDDGGVLTRANAAGELFIFELSARIGQLEASGYKVAKSKVKYKSQRSGRTINLMEYRKA